MDFVIRMFFNLIFEMAAYNTGYYVWFIVPTKIRIEPLAKQKERKKQERFSLTYNRGKTKYLFHDSIALFGLTVWFIMGTAVYVIFRINF